MSWCCCGGELSLILTLKNILYNKLHGSPTLQELCFAILSFIFVAVRPAKCHFLSHIIAPCLNLHCFFALRDARPKNLQNNRFWGAPEFL